MAKNNGWPRWTESWIKNVLAEKKDFKGQKDFSSVKDYKDYVTSVKDYTDYVVSHIKPNMIVRCNKAGFWKYCCRKLYDHGIDVEIGNIGFVKNVEFDQVVVKWLTLFPANLEKTEGSFEDLDLLFLLT